MKLVFTAATVALLLLLGPLAAPAAANPCAKHPDKPRCANTETFTPTPSGKPPSRPSGKKHGPVLVEYLTAWLVSEQTRTADGNWIDVMRVVLLPSGVRPDMP